jgi:hypothetical protein
MKASLALAAIIVCVAGVAGAQTAPSKTEATPPPSAKPGTTVSGLTVTAKPKLQPCSSRDKQCIDLVVAELKVQYPEELKRFCFQREQRAVRTQLAHDRIVEDLGGNNPPTPTAFGVNSAMKAACATEKK